MSSDLEDSSKHLIKVQADGVHCNAQSNDKAIVVDDHVNPNGIEIDPVSSEDKVVFIPPSKKTSSETTGATSLVSVSPVANSAGKEKDNAFVVQITVGRSIPIAKSAGKEKDNTFVVQMTVGASTKEKALFSRMSTQWSLRRQPSLLRRGSVLSRQESWRTKASGTRIKNKRNYISFHNITYTVPQGWFFQKKPPKVILNDIRLVYVVRYTKIW